MAAQASRGMDRNGVAIAVGLHVLVIGLLSVQWPAGDRTFDNPPMEADLLADHPATSPAPEHTDPPPPTRLGAASPDELSPTTTSVVSANNWPCSPAHRDSR